MAIDPPVVISAGNLSLAWAMAFLRLMDAPGGRLASPLIVSIDEFNADGEPVEHAGIRPAVDQTIDDINRRARRQGRPLPLVTISGTAQTIFPHMSWSPRSPIPADDLFSRYRDRIFPRLRGLCQKNSHGTYFLRMIDYTGCAANATGKGPVKHVNQLGEILRWWHRGASRPRRSALQVSLYDPPKDHTGAAQAGFPCLQQVSFAYEEDDLALGAYYPTEYIYSRGYGNYLGLCRLGAFMAHEMSLRLARVTVFIQSPSLGLTKGVTKTRLRRLATILRPLTTESGTRERLSA